MRHPARTDKHTYRLVLFDDGRGCPRRIEFEASGADAALSIAQNECLGREAELFEDLRSLGRVKCARNGGFWVISPAPPERV